MLCFSMGSADHLVVHQASAAHAPDILIVPSNLPCYIQAFRLPKHAKAKAFLAKD